LFAEVGEPLFFFLGFKFYRKKPAQKKAKGSFVSPPPPPNKKSAFITGEVDLGFVKPKKSRN